MITWKVQGQMSDPRQNLGVIPLRYEQLVNPSGRTEHNLEPFITSMTCFNILTILVEGKRFYPVNIPYLIITTQSYSPSYSTKESHLSLHPIFLPLWCDYICSISWLVQRKNGQCIYHPSLGGVETLELIVRVEQNLRFPNKRKQRKNHFHIEIQLEFNEFPSFISTLR